MVDGSLTATGKPLLANDPHRPVQIPSLRKTVHLVAPGWNVIGAGEPALPGIALGHNERIAFGFTIVGIDQQDLYVEKLNPANPGQYRYRGAWRNVEIERQTIEVRGAAPQTVELRYTVHGPDHSRGPRPAPRLRTALGGHGTRHGRVPGRACRWRARATGTSSSPPWSATKCPAKTWSTPTWTATSAGRRPDSRRCARTGPGCSRCRATPANTSGAASARLDELPRLYNPPEHFIATANHNILPPGYTHPARLRVGASRSATSASAKC